MSWHHLIPYSLLKDVWKRLVDLHLASASKEAAMPIRQYLRLADRNFHDLDQKLNRMRISHSHQRRASHNEMRPIEIAEIDELRTAASWPVWNVVEGPNNRSDDPKDHDFERFSFGLTPVQSMRMRCVELMYAEMRIFVASGPGVASSRRFGEAIRTARLMAGGDEPIRFSAEMWVMESDGRWHKRRGEA